MKNLYKKQTSKTIVLLDSIGQNSSLCHNEHMNFTLENNVLRGHFFWRKPYLRF